MAQNSHEFHHFFPKLAEESGFTFNIHRPRVHVDWNKFRSIDIDSVIKDRKFYVIEQYLNDILHCVLESEFDVRILDAGFLKMFRLAQLAVEYQQFCRHYLDRSVFVLKEEVTGLAQELNATKKDLQEKCEEIKRLKRKSKHTYRSPLPYGNDNIAAMILKTLSNKSDLFGIPSTSNAGSKQYNKCNLCDKVFLNQLYLKSHLSRRHSNMLDNPEKDVTDNNQNNPNYVKEKPKLNEEVEELKAKLKDMEHLLLKVNNERNTHNIPNTSVISDAKPELSRNNQNVRPVENNIMRDAEVSTNIENNNLLDKIEEWKREEHERHKAEITLLRAEFEDIVNSLKNKGSEKFNAKEQNFIEQLYTTIKQQGAEINALKEELSKARTSTEKDDTKRKLEAEPQASLWIKRVEQQTKQYEALLQQLNVVAQEARDARAQAEAERARAAQLQVLLEGSINKGTVGIDHPKTQSSTRRKLTNGDVKKKTAKRKQKPEPDSKTFETLHRKAQELLNMRSLSSSEISSLSSETAQVVLPKNHRMTKAIPEQKEPYQVKPVGNQNRDNEKNLTKVKIQRNKDEPGEQKEIKHKLKKEKVKARANKPSYMGNGIITTPGSPLKLVRAKITEEVNSRLVTIGVDPLKNRLPKSYYRKQKLQLQQQHEAKSKKNPEYEKVKHSLLAYLDINTPTKKKNTREVEDHVSPNQISKAFSFTSVISSVKNKAMSLVKSNGTNKNFTKHTEINKEVAKKAMSYLKTPPSSVSSSPVKQKKVEEIKTAFSAEEIRPRLQRNKTITARATDDSETQAHIVSQKEINVKSYTTDDDSTESNHKYYNSATSHSTRSIDQTKSIENLIKSPARRPSSASAINSSSRKVTEKQDENIIRSKSAVDITEYNVGSNRKQNTSTTSSPKNAAFSSDEIESLDESSTKKPIIEEHSTKQTKGVLKNASSTSSLNKKKVLFDMDAIQMKSVSASPSQSITEKSEHNEKYELGLININDGEEWDISSIENEPLKKDTKIQLNTRASPKIAELKQTIESQLARRNDTPSTTLVGGVNLLPTAVRNSSIAGSNTSLGSSILDESDGIPKVQRKAFTISKKAAEKEDSEIDLSDYSFNDTGYKKVNTNDSF